jgi:hypothetical protein
MVGSQLPESISQGDTVDLRLMLRNSGEKEAEGTSVRVFEKIEQPFEYEEKSDNVGLLEPGEEGEALLEFTVDQNADTKGYILEFETRYTDSDDVYTRTESIQFDVLPSEDSGFPMELVAVLLVVLIVAGLFWRIANKKGMLG